GATTNILCSTCNLNQEMCQGHLGVLRFIIPVLNPFFSEISVRLLNCVCHFCLEFYISEEQMRDLLPDKEMNISQKLTILKKASNSAYCKNLTHPRRKYSIRKIKKLRQLQYFVQRSDNKDKTKNFIPVVFDEVV